MATVWEAQTAVTPGWTALSAAPGPPGPGSAIPWAGLQITMEHLEVTFILLLISKLYKKSEKARQDKKEDLRLCGTELDRVEQRKPIPSTYQSTPELPT